MYLTFTNKVKLLLQPFLSIFPKNINRGWLSNLPEAHLPWGKVATKFIMYGFCRQNCLCPRKIWPWKFLEKRYLIIDQQIALHFVHCSECLYYPPSLLYNSNNQPFLYFKDLIQSRERVRFLVNQGILILLNIPLM